MNHGAKTSELAGEPQEDGAFLDSVDPPADLPDPDLGENSLKVLERRYLIRGDDGELAETPRQMFWRVARTVASAEVKLGNNDVSLKLSVGSVSQVDCPNEMVPKSSRESELSPWSLTRLT